MQEEKQFLTADDVMKIAGCGKVTAYRLINKCNDELKKMGKFTLNGKVNAKYFMSRFEV